MTGKILVVDDDSATRMVLSDFLSELQRDHVVVESGSKCLALLTSAPEDFSLIFMDMHMPALSGVDTVSWIKGSEVQAMRQIPVYAITGDTRFLDADTLMQNNLLGVLRKPVTKQDLRQVLDLQTA